MTKETIAAGENNKDIKLIEAEELTSRMKERGEWFIDGDWRGKDLVSVEQINRLAAITALDRADKLEALYTNNRESIRGMLRNTVVAVLFEQESTRTYNSSVLAAYILGATVLGNDGMNHFSSMKKGEDLHDTAMAFEANADVIVLRHSDINSSLIAANAVGIPVINAGSGPGEHPTQALLDVRTIFKERGLDVLNDDLSGLVIGMVGDLKYGRTIHSLAKLAAEMGCVNMVMASHEEVKLPEEIKKWLLDRGVNLLEVDDLSLINELDVLYVTRIQREWFKSVSEYERVQGSLRITPEVMMNAKPNAVLMHPLPRVGEIVKAVDKDPRAAYFRQMAHGKWVRASLMTLIVGDY